MKTSQVIGCFLILGLSIQCAPKSTFVKNIDSNAPIPILSHKNRFKLTESAPDAKYGYTSSYPINVFYVDAMNDTLNAQRFLNALAGPKGEKLQVQRKESCCPFPTKNHPLGAGMLEVYEVTWEGNKKPLTLYFNVYERGRLYIPKGLTAKKED